MTKFLLKRDLPLTKVGTEIYLKKVKDTNYSSMLLDDDSSVWDILDKDITEWLEEVKEQKEEKSIWNIKNWESYYRLQLCIILTTWDDDLYNKSYRDMWLAFLTKEEAEKELEKRKAIVKLNRIIDEKNMEDWFVVDWKSIKQEKCTIYNDSDYAYNYYLIHTCYSIQYWNQIKCSTKETCQFIIDNHKDLLDIAFKN